MWRTRQQGQWTKQRNHESCRNHSLETPQLSQLDSYETEVLTAVNMKSSIFWDITQFSMVKGHWSFGGTYRLHLQGWRTSQAKNQGKHAERSVGYLLWFCYLLLYCKQWLSLFRLLALTAVLEVRTTHISVFCEVKSKYLKLVTMHSVATK
jgi:hypothetical protein